MSEMTDAPRPDLTAADWAAMRATIEHEERATTHWDGCWTTHRNCRTLLALDALARQQEANARLTAARSHATCHDMECNTGPTLPRGVLGCSCQGRVDRALAERDATVKQAHEAHAASFGALATLSASLFDGEVDDYNALAQRVINLVADRDATIARLTAMLAECYRLSGADPDGNEDWRLAEDVVDAVRELRESHDAEQAINVKAIAASCDESRRTRLVKAEAALADRDATIARLREAVEAAVSDLDHIASAGAPRPPGGQQVGPGVYQMTLSTSQAIKRALHELTRRTVAALTPAKEADRG